MSDAPWQPSDLIAVADLEAALRAVHAMAMQSGHTADRVEALLMALIKALLDAGQLERAAFDRALADRQAAPRQRSGPVVELAAPLDKHQVKSPPDLDCAALLPLCQARCCRLSVLLSPQDLEEGRLSWDYGRPFRLARGADGACVHQDQASGGCTVYGVRPAACRRYDCRKDPRIWVDFERRIVAPLEALSPGPSDQPGGGSGSSDPAGSAASGDSSMRDAPSPGGRRMS
jgi:hypothetical protein